MRLLKSTAFVATLLLFTSCSRQGLIPFVQDGKHGYRHLSGEIVIPPKFENLGWGNLYDYILARENGKWGIINRKGRFVLPPAYKDYFEFDQNGYAVLNDGSYGGYYGMINRKGKTIIPFIYSRISRVHDGVAIVSKDERYGLLDEHGKQMIAREYEGMNQTKQSGYLTARKNGKWGVINYNNEVIVPFEYDSLDSWRKWTEGTIPAQRNGKWGLIDFDNRVVIPFEHNKIYPFSEGVALVQQSLFEFGFVDRENHVVVPFTYRGLTEMKNGIAIAEKDNLFGCIDQVGDVVVPFKYYRIEQLCNRRTYREISNGKQYTLEFKLLQWGYADSAGNELLIAPYNAETPEWGTISKAPEEIPDHSDTLCNEITVYVPGLVIREITKSESTGISDTIQVVHVYDNDTSYSRELTADEERGYRVQKWTLESLLEHALHAFREEPRSYADRCDVPKICVGYGLLLAVGNYSEDFMYPPDGWEVFKKETIYKIISSEHLRKITWEWIAPYYKKSFQTMHPYHQQIYKDIAVYMKSYINSYDQKQVERYLKRNERDFAHYDINGNYDQYRKLSAFVDRLILVHKVLEPEDAKTWINKIADEVAQW